VRLTLITRAYCHLCDEMRDALAARASALDFAVDERDVDADAALEARWGDKVPVLLDGERELCRYRLDPAALEVVARAAERGS